jgi:hypothetical protein
MLSGVGINDTELRYIEFIYIEYCNKWKKKSETVEDCTNG